ncbi:unnamed protein product [Brassicogethes aeneus]|uniref:Craniofacial development protein 1 n=1 Tax=Brassicogethes aeneus TaxID=1431903 RepID=A0A9P0F9J3_BRAAE|nr:unnamed protein product [Brassicogethes aeneus]
MNIADLQDDSDTSDEDYVPGEKAEEVPSEVDSDGEPEDQLSDPENVETRGLKRKRKIKKTKKKSKKEFQESGTSTETETKTKVNEDVKKKVEDDIWADFMKDTGFQSRDSRLSGTSQPTKLEVPSCKPEMKQTETKKSHPETVKITQIFEFAGEEVKVEKHVPVDSAEARLCQPSNSNSQKTPVRSSLSGISSVLSQLGKKAKISTLEKTKLDWDSYKKQENIEEELQNYNKGKDGYLDRQDFLERADHRRFEIEREIRTIERNKRMNNTL